LLAESAGGKSGAAEDQPKQFAIKEKNHRGDNPRDDGGQTGIDEGARGRNPSAASSHSGRAKKIS